MKQNEYNDKNAIFAGETHVFFVVLLKFYAHVDDKMFQKPKLGQIHKPHFFNDLILTDEQVQP